ncbi:MAG: DUF3800 domain-containing protein [Bacilli bacterium]|nr:DUF3800 domain-containing protein [Bacilli bacterium]
MSKWYDRPTKILKMGKDIDYVMCIDENGSSNNLTYVLKQISNDREVSEDDKYFTITGCIFTKEQYMNSKKIIKSLKNKYWENGVFYDRKMKKDKAVCFHSREIRKHDNCFNDKIINYEEFMIELTDVMKKIECKIISISINLYEYLKKGYTHNVYNVAFDFLLERYIYATRNNKKGIIMLEARGKDEDKELLEHISKVINKTGTKKISSKELFSKIDGVYFNPKWNEEYSSTYVGLEITDLFSYPIHKYVKRNTKDKAFLTFETKIEGYPNYKNKGIKIFP